MHDSAGAVLKGQQQHQASEATAHLQLESESKDLELALQASK